MKKYIIITLISLFIIPASYAQDAHNLLAKLDNIMFSPKDKQGKLAIILIDSDGDEKVREAEMFQKGRDKKLYRYTSPEKQAGTATLSLPGGIMWLYMPAFGKARKITLLAKNQSFTGTDFSYEDMATEPFSDRYLPQLIESTDDTFLLSLTPRDGKSNYSKVIVTQDKTNYYPLKMEYFDKGGNKFKEATYQYEKIGKYWNAKEVMMTNIKKNHSTKIQLKEVLFDQGLSDEMFEVDNLKPVEEE